MKWKSKTSGRIITVLGDEIENGKKYRFYTFDDHPDTLMQWDLIYAAPWEDHFVSLDNSVKV